jgi:uncharacterized membrane protein
VFAWFWKTMAPGWSLSPQAFTPEALGRVFLSLVIVTIAYHIVISLIFEFRRRNAGIERDERDDLIQSHSSRLAYTVLQFGVGVIAIMGLLSYIGGADYLSLLRIETPVQYIFSLVAVSYLASLIRYGSAVIRYSAT